MKIVVLAGGLSTERQVALTSGTGVCRALRERGHQAILVDMFLGLESYEGRLEDIFDAPDGLCGDNRVTEEAPDLEAVRRSRKDQGPSLLGKDVLAVCAMADIVFLALHGSCGEDGRIRPRWICWEYPTPALAIWAAAWPWTNPLPSGFWSLRGFARRRGVTSITRPPISPVWWRSWRSPAP